MKTTIKIRFFAITALMAAIVVGNNFEANAQRRDSREGKQEERSESPSNQKIENKRDDHSRNDRDDREIRSYSDTRRYEYAKQNDSYRRHENERRDYDQEKNKGTHSEYDRERHEKSDYQRYYDRKDSHADHRDFYYHSQYGKTYRNFHSNPLVFRHNHGRYYYYDGHFCDYRPGIGYVIVDIPYLTVFATLPFHCNRIRIHGNVYYQYGNLYFEVLPIGYRLVRSPLQIQISAHF